MKDLEQEFENYIVFFIRGVFLGLLFGLVLNNCEAKADTKLIEEKILAASASSQIDPYLILAIAQIESSYNPKAVGKIGEIGLYQLRPEFHPIRKTDSIERQTKIAIKYLKKLQASCFDKVLQCWNMGPTRAKKYKYASTNYERKVLNAYKNLLHSRGFPSFKGQTIIAKEFEQ